jgi:hypothetical protein
MQQRNSADCVKFDGRMFETSPVYLVGLVEPNKRDKPNNGLPTPANIFSILLERVDPMMVWDAR